MYFSSSRCWIMILPLHRLTLSQTKHWHHSSISQHSNHTSGVPSTERPWLSSYSFVPMKRDISISKPKKCLKIYHCIINEWIIHKRHRNKVLQSFWCAVGRGHITDADLNKSNESVSINRPMLSILKRSKTFWSVISKVLNQMLSCT